MCVRDSLHVQLSHVFLPIFFTKQLQFNALVSLSLYMRREVVFKYDFGSLDSFDEGFEVSFRNHKNGGGRWIPLWFFSAHESTNRTVHNISLGDIITDDGLLTLRGYTVNFTISENNLTEANIKLCGPGVFDDQAAKGLFNWQFRWLQTVVNDSMSDENEDDVIYIYNVSITVVNNTQIFHDDFSKDGKLR